MNDTLSLEQRSQRMSLIRSQNTQPEMFVRRLVHSLGYRYRLHGRLLPGKPDLVFAGKRKVIFIHGCFWHRHSDPDCKLSRLPKTRLDFWLPKLNRNQNRDQENLSKLDQMGWKALVIWECELKDESALAACLREFLK